MKNLVAMAVLGLAVCGAAVWAEGAATEPATPTAKATSMMAAPATAPAAEPASAFKTDKEKIGYAIGLQIGLKLKGVDVDPAALAAGVHDSSTGATPKMSDQEIMQTMMALQKQMQAAEVAAGAEHLKAGEAFLAANAKKKGVTTTASGLQYKVVTSGSGKSPKATDTVSVNYKGMLIDGKVFDESHGEPVTFQVNQVIPGWTEALQLMKVGDKWTIYIPSKLAYGPRGTPDGSIGGNEPLIFDVELIAIK